MKFQGVTWADFLKDIDSNDKILLINPPVKELRYAWYRWNQPLDLLRLSSYLKEKIGCHVEMYDFMLPEQSGKPRMTSTTFDLRKFKDVEFQFRLYGRPLSEFEKLLDNEIKEWKPAKVIVTSLTSYWWEGINLLNSSIKTILNNVPIYVMGNYPKYEKNHVKYVFPDFYLSDEIDLTREEPDFNLYFGKMGQILNPSKPHFASFTLDTEKIDQTINKLCNNGVKDFVFFEADVLENKTKFKEILSLIKDLRATQPEIKFHGICGFYPSKFEPGILKLMSEAGFIELHLEYDCIDEELNLDAYCNFREFLESENVNFASGSLSGFVNFGYKGEVFDRTMLHSLQVLELLGSFIPKPFTAVPGTEEYQLLRSKLKASELQFLSPHAYPFAEENNIKVEEYQNYLRLSGFLNNKVRGKCFDFFDESLISRAVRDAFSKESW